VSQGPRNGLLPPGCHHSQLMRGLRSPVPLTWLHACPHVGQRQLLPGAARRYCTSLGSSPSWSSTLRGGSWSASYAPACPHSQHSCVDALSLALASRQGLPLRPAHLATMALRPVAGDLLRGEVLPSALAVVAVAHPVPRHEVQADGATPSQRAARLPA